MGSFPRLLSDVPLESEDRVDREAPLIVVGANGVVHRVGGGGPVVANLGTNHHVGMRLVVDAAGDVVVRDVIASDVNIALPPFHPATNTPAIVEFVEQVVGQAAGLSVKRVVRAAA